MVFPANFYWLWHFQPENLKLIDKLQIWSFESLISGPSFVFLRMFYGILVSVILKLFVVGQPWWPTFSLSPFYSEFSGYWSMQTGNITRIHSALEKVSLEVTSLRNLNYLLYMLLKWVLEVSIKFQSIYLTAALYFRNRQILVSLLNPWDSKLEYIQNF